MNLDILLPYQKAWIEDAAPVKVWKKSRRIGASYVEALASVLEASKSKEAGGQSTYYISYLKGDDTAVRQGRGVLGEAH
jgi:phage FluMu gp28-like protein